MTDQPYRNALETFIAAHANPTHKFGHQPRLYALTQEIGEGLTYDDDVVFAAVWLHDLGVFIGQRPEDTEDLKTWDHVAYVIEKAPAILKEAAFPEEKIPAVLEGIRTHQPQDTPLTPEATIVRDADILEQLGAIGILRTVCKIGRDTRFQNFTAAVNSLRNALANLPPRITLKPARKLAQPKIAALARFLEAIDNESYGFLL
jgi:uncharacterized protein